MTFKSSKLNKDLIFDIGFHTGQDTEFYLKKGFCVVAVDANPILIEEGKTKFSEYIKAEKLILLNLGIGRRKEKLPFFVNKSFSEWSSFDKNLGTSRGDFFIVDIPLIPLKTLIVKYGVPYYIKIDIEGHDIMAIESLRGIDDKPKYISAENGQTSMIDELYSQGYRKFKFVNQSIVQKVVLPVPPRERGYIEHRFPFGTSGPFGDEIDGEWLDRDSVLRLSNKYWGNPERDANVHGWYDLHASL